MDQTHAIYLAPQIAIMSSAEFTNTSDTNTSAARTPSKNARFFIETVTFLVGDIHIVIVHKS